MGRLINNLAPIIYGDGSQTRDFVNIKDIVNANMLSMESNNAVGDIFNIGNGVPTSILDPVQIANNTIGKKEIYSKYTDARAGILSIFRTFLWVCNRLPKSY